MSPQKTPKMKPSQTPQLMQSYYTQEEAYWVCDIMVQGVHVWYPLDKDWDTSLGSGSRQSTDLPVDVKKLYIRQTINKKNQYKD